MEGVGWLDNMRSPAFKIGIHRARRWFNGSWLMPAENGYSRAIPLRWLPAFNAKSKPVAHEPCTEWQAAQVVLTWLRTQFRACGRASQRLLMVADGSYDTLELYHLPGAPTGRGRPRKYGIRAPRSAWVYAVLLLAGYRTWGLDGAPPVPIRWWRGSGRWSLNTLWRGSGRLMGPVCFSPLILPDPHRLT